MYSLLLLNGGIGSRVGAGQPKQFLKVKGIPLLVYPLTVADRIPEIAEIVMNFPAGQLDAVQKLVGDYAIETPVTYVEAGATRHESVAALVPHATYEQVLVHEAARPLASVQDFRRLIDSEYRNVSLMHPIPFTVAPVDPEAHTVTGSLDRSRLRNVQLPQKFAKDDLASAHAAAAERHETFTEDATLVATQGYPVHFVDGSDINLKVTTPVDVRLAAFLMHDGEEEE